MLYTGERACKHLHHWRHGTLSPSLFPLLQTLPLRHTDLNCDDSIGRWFFFSTPRQESHGRQLRHGRSLTANGQLVGVGVHQRPCDSNRNTMIAATTICYSLKGSHFHFSLSIYFPSKERGRWKAGKIDITNGVDAHITSFQSQFYGLNKVCRCKLDFPHRVNLLCAASVWST